MNSACHNDEWLMAQVAAGNRDCLEPLVRRYASPLLSFIDRMIGDWHRSEELFQETFLAVWIKRRQYQFPRPFKPWLFAIALNRCRAAFRSPHLPRSFPPDKDCPVVAKGSLAADVLIANETAALVAAAVCQLPPQQRAVMVLRVWQGLSYAEIAKATGRTEGTVRAHMHHALTAMRKHLEPRLH
jgi:RNA polymerase sigma-70 factor (ECF subfamily)